MSRSKSKIRGRKTRARTGGLAVFRLLRQGRIRQYAFAVSVFGLLLVVVAVSSARRTEDAKSLGLPADPVAVEAPVESSNPPVETIEVTNPSEPQTKSSNEDAEAWSYFHPTWQQEPVLTPSLDAVGIQLHQAQHGGAIDRWVEDPEQKISDEFSVPPAMRERVLFWMRVHSRFSSQMRVLHDRRNLSIVYGYSDFSDVYKKSENKVKAFYQALQYERRILRGLRARLAEAAGLSKTGLLTSWEKAELRALLSRAGALDPKGVNDLLENIRSQSGQRDEFLAALERSEHLLPFIESVFLRMGLPTALARVPFVESSFNVRAQSKVGAMGMWQFMPETARQMIGPNPAHWSDPLNQTWAAAKLLKILRTALPDWSTAITSYNSGAGRLKNLCKRYKTNSIVKLLDVSGGNSLGFAGKNFYAQFLSVNIVEAYKYEIFSELRSEQHEAVAFNPVASFGKTFR